MLAERQLLSHPQLARYSDLILVLTQKELRVRYKSYILGYLWSLLNPLFQCVLFYFVFSVIMKVAVPNFLSYLISGLFSWQWISNSLGTAPMIFLGNAPLIKKVPFPRFLLVLVNNLQDLFHFSMSLPIILVVLWFQKVPLHLESLALAPVIMALQLALTFAIALTIATLNLFFRDLERIVSLSLMFLFYGTPIVYEAQSIPDKYSWILHINPMAQLMIAWRHLLLDGFLDLGAIANLLLLIAPLLLVALFTYRTLEYRFAEVL